MRRLTHQRLQSKNCTWRIEIFAKGHYYLDALKRWEHRREKCVDLEKDYVEKKINKKNILYLC